MGSAAPARRAGWIERPDCRRIRYEATGEGPAIVLARSRGTNLMSWLQQAAHFAPRRRCVAFSHRVLFPSTAPVSGPDPALYADDLAALVDALGLRDVRLVCPPWTAGRAWSTRCSGRGGVKPLVLLASTGSLDPRQVSEPERSRLERWDAEGAVAAAIPGARAAPLARAGHPGRFERAAAFNAPVESIVAEVGA